MRSDGNDGSRNANAGSRENNTRMVRKRIARWIRKARIRGGSRCVGFVLTPDVIQSNGRCGIWSTANSLQMDRIHFGAADMNNLPTSSRFSDLATEGDFRAVSTA